MSEPLSLRWHRPSSYALCGTLMLAFCALIQAFSYLNPDCAWLLELAQRVLAGERLYLDVSETNPPLIVWLNMAPALLSHSVGISLHHALIVCVSLLSAAGLWLAWRANPAYPVLNYSYGFFITVLAAHNYGEREHLFLILALPYLFSLLPPNRPSILAAFIAAIGFALKPYFVVILLLVALMRAWQHRSFWSLFAGHYLLIAALVGGYGAWLLFIDTTYLDSTVRVLLDLYVTFHTSQAELWTNIAVLCGIFLLPYALALPALTLDSRRLHCRALHLLFMVCVGAVITVWMQQRSWLNHWFLYLGCAFILNSYILSLFWRHRHLFRQKLVFCFALLPLAIQLWFSGNAMVDMLRKDWPPDAPALVALMQQPDATTLLPLSFDLPSGYPYSIHAGLQQVGTYAHLWFLAGFYYDGLTAPDQEPDYHTPAQMQPYERQFFERVVNDVVQKKPDIVLVTERNDYLHVVHGTFAFDFIRYYAQDARFAKAWQHYQSVGKAGDQRIYRRVTVAAPQNSAPQMAPALP